MIKTDREVVSPYEDGNAPTSFDTTSDAKVEASANDIDEITG
jgi:hypothetical protein